MLQQFFISLNVLAWEVLIADENRRDFRTREDLTHALIRRDGNLLVRGRCEDVGIDDGRVARVSGADRHVAPRDGRHEGGGDGRVLVSVGRLGGAEIA